MSNSHIPIRITTRTLDLFSAQQVLDFVVGEMLRQGQPAVSVQAMPDRDGGLVYRTLCEYKTTNGHRCAVGVLIPDDCDPRSIVGTLAHWDEGKFARVGWPMNARRVPVHLQLLTDLQRCHDEAAMGLGHDFKTGFLHRVWQMLKRHEDLHMPAVANDHGRFAHEKRVFDLHTWMPVFMHGGDAGQPQCAPQSKLCIPVFS